MRRRGYRVGVEEVEMVEKSLAGVGYCIGLSCLPFYQPTNRVRDATRPTGSAGAGR